MQVTYLTKAASPFIAAVNYNHYKQKVTNIASPIRPLLRTKSLHELPTPLEQAMHSFVIRFNEKNYPPINQIYVGSLQSAYDIGEFEVRPGDIVLVGDLDSNEHDNFQPPLSGSYKVWLRQYKQDSCGKDTFSILTHELILVAQDRHDPDIHGEQYRSKTLSVLFRTGSLGFVLYNPIKLNNYVTKVGADKPILDRFTTTNEGEQLMRYGCLLPVLGIQSRTYQIFIRSAFDPPLATEWIGRKIRPKRDFALNIEPDGELILADADLLLSWEPRRALITSLAVTPGPKLAEICGYVKTSSRWNLPLLVSYDILLTDKGELPTEIDDPLINEDLFSIYLEENPD